MTTSLKIRFGGTKREIEPFWLPVIVELQKRDTDKIVRYPIEDPQKDLVDDANLGICYYRISDLEEGNYAIEIIDCHQGHSISREPDLEIKGAEVEYTILREEGDVVSPVFQANTFAMDLIVDAPHRLQRSCPYLPVVVYIKDIEPGDIKMISIDFSIYTQERAGRYTPLPENAVYQVLDQFGEKVEENGRPALLRFDAGEDHETVMTDPWYRIVLLHRDQFHVCRGKHLGYEDIAYFQYRVKVKYRRFFKDSKRFVLRTIVPESDLPGMDDWYYGDTHYHSDFTDNPYEYGGPLSMTAEAARAVGLSWVTITDHSYGLSRPRTQEEIQQGNRWQSLKKAVHEVNERYNDVLLIGAEEITVKKPISGLHLLSYKNPFVEDLHPAGFGTFTMAEALDTILENSGNSPGLLYAAHPASKGYTWDDGDYRIASDPKYSNLFAGLQIFNEKILYAHTTRSSMDRDTVDPFELLDEGKRRRPWSKELQEGIREHWVEKFLLPSLGEYRRSGILRKYFVAAGSDAHMDFNYSFRPHPAFLIHNLYDNAFGKVRTLAYLPKRNGKALTEDNLHEALRYGRTLLTDGPVALFYLRCEGAETVYGFGETVECVSGANLEIILEWQSSSEFGPIHEMSLYLGTEEGEGNITDQLDIPSALDANMGFGGRITRVLPEWRTSLSYLRLEALAGVDPETGEGLFRCVTNPIWIIAQ